MSTPPLAGGTTGPDALRPLLAVVLDALHDGAADRGGPLPAGGPDTVAARMRQAAEPVLPDTGTGAGEALRSLVHAVAYGSADPADPLCAAHLHTPPLALAVAADLAASALNASMDSWDQAPAASELEAAVTRTLAAEVYPHGPDPDALVTTGGTESNQLGLLLARERHGSVQVVCGAGAHHSVYRAAWLLGLPEPVTVPSGVLDPAALDEALTDLSGPLLVVATAGTTDTGRIDPLPEIADLCERHGAELHIDAAYGGPLLFSAERRGKLAGLDRAHSVTLDLHKLGWQPVAAGLLAVPDRAHLAPLGHTADYLNADDDTEAGLPDLLGRSLRTTRRPDILKIAVTLRALGRTGLGALVDRTCATARLLADLIEKTPRLELYERPTLSTVLFRPTGATDEQTAAIRRTLLAEGRAVLGRARADGRLWLKTTLLNPHATPRDLANLIELVEGSTPR
ncbi:aminotransferase class V-fold PLP-dependent enzyme [Streptomyces lunaelactis]|uniref:pyridoxal phosphate-dependent decarboxylase family protein n=1 Tax=Streptomyces lunaelactis TaxID=1535768 RepID=UPI0015855579|nr:aminotransferase class V-fold PLP-dependent enzyme [Streptomyces lunaelactis]NUK49771.1 aminotransferase class V-fold PLP-dependent enzyme [Streptomyces lunaelactis]